MSLCIGTDYLLFLNMHRGLKVLNLIEKAKKRKLKMTITLKGCGDMEA